MHVNLSQTHLESTEGMDRQGFHKNVDQMTH